jgi:hypothetical protein
MYVQTSPPPKGGAPCRHTELRQPSAGPGFRIGISERHLGIGCALVFHGRRGIQGMTHRLLA